MYLRHCKNLFALTLSKSFFVSCVKISSISVDSNQAPMYLRQCKNLLLLSPKAFFVSRLVEISSIRADFPHSVGIDPHMCTLSCPLLRQNLSLLSAHSSPDYQCFMVRYPHKSYIIIIIIIIVVVDILSEAMWLLLACKYENNSWACLDHERPAHNGCRSGAWGDALNDPYLPVITATASAAPASASANIHPSSHPSFYWSVWWP